MKDDYDGTVDDFTGWSLHAHPVCTIDRLAVLTSVESYDLRVAFEGAVHLLRSTECYGVVDRPPLAKSQVPISKFTEEQWAEFPDVGKIRPLGCQDIRAAVCGFTVDCQAALAPYL